MALEATPVKGADNKITGFSFQAATVAEEGVQVTLKKITDEKLVIVVQNTGEAGTIALKAPTNGSYAAADADEVYNIEAGAFAFIRLESARYANNDGTVLLVPSNVAIKVAVLC